MEGENNLSKILSLVKSENEESVVLGWEIAKYLNKKGLVSELIKKDARANRIRYNRLAAQKISGRDYKQYLGSCSKYRDAAFRLAKNLKIGGF